MSKKQKRGITQKDLDSVTKPPAEGFVVYHGPPEPPRVPYPEPVKVEDPLHLHKSRLKSLLQILRKHMELANNILLALSRVRDPQMKQLLEANYRHEIMEMEQTWQEAITEMIAVTMRKGS